MLWKQIDVVGDDHDVADDEFRIHSSGGVAHKQCLDAQRLHHSYRESDSLHVITLIEMKSALHSHDPLVAKIAEYQIP